MGKNEKSTPFLGDLYVFEFGHKCHWVHIVCCLPVFVIDSFLPWQSGNTEQFISLQSVFLRSFQQGLTPEVPAPKAAAAADKKHSSVPQCNGK